MSGSDGPPEEEANRETDRTATGDPEDEIEEAYSSWQESRLTQEEAARMLGAKYVGA